MNPERNGFRSVLFLMFLLAAVFGGATNGRADNGHVNIITIKDTINPGTEDFVKYAVDKSTSDGAEALVILLDTPGGLMTSMRGIAQAILNSVAPIIVYVSPSGAQAASAGVFVTAAADIAVMAPGTNIGAAHPVMGGTGGDVPSNMDKKVMNDMLAFARSIAAQRGRNSVWLEEAVRNSVSATAGEAFELQVIDLVEENLDSLLARVDGWEIHKKGGSRVIHTAGTERRVLETSLKYDFLRVVGNPNIAYILLMIGLAGLYFELSQPGAVVPGVIGGIAIILALYALQTLPVNYAGLLLILLALVFFILEIKVASYGMLSFAGVLSLLLGSLMLFSATDPASRLALSVVLPTVGIVSAFFISIATLAFRAQRRKPQAGPEALIGQTGRVERDLAPDGKVFVSGELWNAYADEPIRVGEMVRVLSLENLKLKVERIDAR